VVSGFGGHVCSFSRWLYRQKTKCLLSVFLRRINAIRVRFGKFLIPFGVFNEIHTAKPAFLSVKEAGSTNKAERIVDNAFRFFPRWGAGIALNGDIVLGEKSLDYDLLFSNGEQEDENPYEEDNNISKAVTFRTRMDVNESINVGLSLYKDTYSSDKEVAGNLQSTGFQTRYQATTDLEVLFEIVQGVKTDLDTDSGDDVSVTQTGWFVQPSYSIGSTTGYLRHEVIDPDADTEDDGGTTTILGANIELDGAMNIKLEHHTVKGEDNAAGLSDFEGKGYSELKAAVVVGW
jgi:hypothetical protein